MSRVGDIEDRAYKTYKSRILSADRLRHRGAAWNTALLSASTSSTIAGIALIAEPDLYGRTGGVVFAAVGVTSLVVSLIVASQNYGARSKDMFVSFRRAQRVAVQAERMRKLNLPDDDPRVDELAEQYQQLLDESENHSHLDYERALIQMGNSASGQRDKSNDDVNQPHNRVAEEERNPRGKLKPSRLHRARRAGELVLTGLPYATLLVPVLLLIPVVRWVLEEG